MDWLGIRPSHSAVAAGVIEAALQGSLLSSNLRRGILSPLGASFGWMTRPPTYNTVSNSYNGNGATLGTPMIGWWILKKNTNTWWFRRSLILIHTHKYVILSYISMLCPMVNTCSKFSHLSEAISWVFSEGWKTHQTWPWQIYPPWVRTDFPMGY